MQPPSTSLLRAVLRPSFSLSTACQRRAASSRSPPSKYVDPKKYHKTNALDKLHRRQKQAIRQEIALSHERANSISSPFSQAPGVDQLSYTKATPQTSSLPYTITRTPSSNLPVYHLTKAGGSKHLTALRKLSGDLIALQNDVRTALGMEQFVVDVLGRKKENVAINWTTRQIVIRGWRGPEIKKWAETRGF